MTAVSSLVLLQNWPLTLDFQCPDFLVQQIEISRKKVINPADILLYYYVTLSVVSFNRNKMCPFVWMFMVTWM